VIQIRLGKKLAQYSLTFVYKSSFHCNSKFIMNSSESNIILLPEHEKSLPFLWALSLCLFLYDLENIFNMLGITGIFFPRFSFLCNTVRTFCMSML